MSRAPTEFGLGNNKCAASIEYLELDIALGTIYLVYRVLQRLAWINASPHVEHAFA